MNILQSLALVAATGGLSACSSDGGDGGGSIGGDAPTFEELAIEAADLVDTYDDVNRALPSDMPTSGSARYDGVAAFSSTAVNPDTIVTDPDSLASVTMTADFTSSDISGRVYDFQSAQDVDIDGELVITEGTIDGAGFSADVGGSLTEDGVDVSYDGSIVGGFLGEDAEAIEGYGAAVATPEGGDPYVVRGVFVAD